MDGKVMKLKVEKLLQVTGYRLQVTNFLIPASSHFHIPTFAHFHIFTFAHSHISMLYTQFRYKIEARVKLDLGYGQEMCLVLL